MKDRNGVQLPYLDKMVFKPIPSATDRLNALEGAAIDAMHTNAYESFEAVAAEPDKYNLASDTEGHRESLYGMLNLSKAPFDDLAIRTAIVAGLDRDRLNRIYSGGTFEVSNGPFDTDVMGYLPGLGGPKYDPEAARKVLEGKNIGFNITYTAAPASKKVAEEIQREMTQVGVKVDITDVDQATTVNKSLEGSYNMILIRNHPGSDPDTQYPWFYGNSPVNFARLKDAELDKLWDEGRTTIDPAARTTIYQEIDQRMSDQAYQVWISRTQTRFATLKDVKNFSNYLLPDDNGVASIEGAGMNWGWSYLTGVWKDSR